MSPHGIFERRAQIRSLGSLPLYFTNQVVVESSAAVDEQLAARGVAPVDWDAVLLSHLDCDHANGLKLLSGIADDRAAQKKSLAWIRAQSRERNCVACIANHDSDVKPGAITL